MTAQPPPTAGPDASTGPTTVRVVVADDQALVRAGIASLLELEADIDVVGLVERGDQLADTVASTSADVALVDIEMPGLDGITAIADLRQRSPSCRSLVVTTFGRPGYLRRALDAGAFGFVVKDTPADRLVDAVRLVARGERVIDSDLAAESLLDGDNPLTEREREVLKVALSGATVRQIANEVHLSEGTVRNYLSTAISKTGSATGIQAAVYARDRGWL